MTLHKNHILYIAYENAAAEDKNSPTAVALEKIVLGGDRDETSLPPTYRSLLDRARCKHWLRNMRDSHVCPVDAEQKAAVEDTGVCTCGFFDAALDSLTADANDTECDDLLSLFGTRLPEENYFPTEADYEQYPEEDWRYLVGNDDTRLGYEEWVVAMLVSNLSETELQTRWGLA